MRFSQFFESHKSRCIAIGSNEVMIDLVLRVFIFWLMSKNSTKNIIVFYILIFKVFLSLDALYISSYYSKMNKIFRLTPSHKT